MLVIVRENGYVLNSSGTASSECHSFFRLLERFFVVVTAASVISVRSRCCLQKTLCLWLAVSVCLLPPVFALLFAPPGNGGIKLGLVDEVRAAVVPILVQDSIPAHLCSGVWDASSP